ncbi:hypothetical protein ACJX0J_040778 [Zea mays]
MSGVVIHHEILPETKRKRRLLIKISCSAAFIRELIVLLEWLDQGNCLITGLCDHIIPSGIIILQYVDDTIMCIKNDLEKAMHLKLVLYLYEPIEIFVINGVNNMAEQYKKKKFMARGW